MNSTGRVLRSSLIAAALIAVGLLAWLNSKLVPDTRILAAHSVAPSGSHQIIFNTGPGGITSTDATPGMASNAALHEIIHALKSTRLFDYDIPYAAALGYYEEWYSDGQLSDLARRRNFEAGATDGRHGATLEHLVKQYRTKGGGEDLQSYADGATIAGIMSSEFGRDKEAAQHFVFCLTMGLDVTDAALLARDSKAYHVITSLRHGSYSIIDKASLEADAHSLDERSRAAIERYVNRLDHQYRSVFILLDADLKRILGGDVEPPDRRIHSRDEVIKSGDMRFRKNVRGKTWPHGQIPLMFADTVSKEKRELFFRATLPLTQRYVMQFIDCEANRCKDTEGYLYIVDGEENSSFVGMVGGRQEVSVATWNLETIVHLLRHILGLGEGPGESLID